MQTQKPDAPHLPIRRNLVPEYLISRAIAVLMIAVSVVGLMYRKSAYPTPESFQAFVPNDAVNLLIGLPILLAAIWLARRRQLIGLLLWPGALFYVFYTYLVYLFSLPMNTLYAIYLALGLLSGYAMLRLVTGIDSQAVQQQLKGRVPEQVGGGVLLGLGFLFFIRVIVLLLNGFIQKTQLPATELALHLADLLITPIWIIAGVLLWQRKALGYVIGLGVLFQASMLFLGLIVLLCLRPLLTATPFPVNDVVVISLMGLVCFIPCVLFIRGVVKSKLNPIG